MKICLKSIPDTTSQAILKDSRVLEILPSLHALCSEAEFELESYYSKRVAGVDTSRAEKELRKFPYFDNYVDLTRLELAVIYAVDPRPIRKVAFIGSGPLPLTSLCALEQIKESLPPQPKSWIGWFKSLLGKKETKEEDEIKVLNIDHNSTAIFLSEALCQNLGKCAKGMEFHHGSAGDNYTSSSSSSSPLPSATKPASSDLAEHDVVFLAALVGSTQAEKESTLRSIVSRMRPGALLVVRSANGLRGLCYPVFDPTTPGVIGDGGLELCLVVHPKTHVVNSVIVGKVAKAFKKDF